MPSTYTDSLGVELQANGENPNTWGVKANTGFSLLEEAVSGYVAVTVSGDTTLTITDGTASSGATDQARKAFIKLTGTPGLAFDLTLPEVSKTWLFWNATDAMATVKTSTATATVALPAGHLVAAQSDGAGSVLQVTPIVADDGKVPLSYIENIGATTISEAQWEYVGEADQPVKTTDAVEFAGITSTDGADITGDLAVSGAAELSGLSYPTTDGVAGQYVTTDGAGNLSFGTPAGGGDVLAAANGSDFADIPTVRSNLGLGTAATKATGTTEGTIPLLGTGGKLPEELLPKLMPQCIQSIKTDTASTTSDAFTDLGLSLTITPTSEESKVMISFDAGLVVSTTLGRGGRFRVLRGATVIGVGDASGSVTQSATATYYSNGVGASFQVLDSPATDSPVTYKIQWARTNSSGTTYLNRTEADSTAAQDRTITTLTALEVS